MSTAPFTTLRLDTVDGLATLTFTQAQRGNPIDGEFCRELRQAALDLWDRTDLRAVLLRAEGANFSYGGDIKAFYPARHELAPKIRLWTADLHAGLARLWKLPVPIVAEVQGIAMGGAVGVLAGADVVVAGESTRLGSAFAQLGFSCDSGTSTTLTARMGTARARRFVLLAEMLGSAEAQQCGLVDFVVPDADLSPHALALAQRLAQGPTAAYGEIKRLFNKAGATPLETQLDDEALTLARMSATSDAQEGVAAMAERRRPVFQGR
jgi:2-(1,2-epoxy-1,2-dihydrophenyl)acetyl-CoA isomerase